MCPLQHIPNTLPGKGLPLSSLYKDSVEALVALASVKCLHRRMRKGNQMTEMKSGTSAGKLRTGCLFYTVRNDAKDKTYLHKSQDVLFVSFLAS